MKWVSKVPTVFLWMKILIEDKRTNLSIYSLYSPIFVDIYNYSEPVPTRHVRSRMCVILRPAWREHHHDRDVNITYCFFQRFFRLRKESLSLHARSVTISKRNLFKLWDSAANDPNFFRRLWHCLQMQAETALMLKSCFVSAVLIEHRPLLIPSKNRS